MADERDRTGRSGGLIPSPQSAASEGQTPERPAPHERGRLGTPAAADAPTPPDEAPVTEHDGGHDGVGSHDEGGAHDEHTEPRLGPIDWQAWGASALGVAVGVMVAALFLLGVRPG